MSVFMMWARAIVQEGRALAGMEAPRSTDLKCNVNIDIRGKEEKTVKT